MNERECAELMQYTQLRLREANLDELLDRITADIGGDQTPASLQLLRMLDRLDSEFRRQASGTADRILAELSRTVTTEDGHAPDGLWLDLAPAHRDLFGTDGVDLRDGLPLDSAIEELDSLRREMRGDDLEDTHGTDV
jgi:hypothetical protein